MSATQDMMRAEDNTGWPALDDIITSSSDIAEHAHFKIL